MRTLFVIVMLCAGHASALTLGEALSDIKSNTRVEIADSIMPAVWQDFKHGGLSYGSALRMVRYRLLELDLGVVAPKDNFKGALAVGPAIQLGDYARMALNWAIDRTPYLKDRLGLIKRNQNYVSLGFSLNYNLGLDIFQPAVFAGLKLPL